VKLIENYVARSEQLLNHVDWIPYVASISGMVRVLAGGVEIAAALAFVYLKLAYNLVNYGRAQFAHTLKQGYTYSLHGVANIIRGAIAIHPWWNLILIAHDWRLGRYNYPQETVPSGVYPLATAHKFA